MQNDAGKPSTRIMDRLALRIWARRLRRADSDDPGALKKIQKRARQLRALLDAVDRAVAGHVESERHQNDDASQPPRTNWIWHPDLRLKTGMKPGGLISSDIAVTSDIRLFHDGKLAEMGLRRSGPTNVRPGVVTDLYEFDGTYVSFAIALPKEAMAGLRLTDLFRFTSDISVERMCEMNIRLNLRHGPNVEQIVRRVDRSLGEQMVEFDISYTAFNPERCTAIWIDIIFNHPRMNRFEIRDVQILRRGRADF